MKWRRKTDGKRGGGCPAWMPLASGINAARERHRYGSRAASMRNSAGFHAAAAGSGGKGARISVLKVLRTDIRGTECKYPAYLSKEPLPLPANKRFPRKARASKSGEITDF